MTWDEGEGERREARRKGGTKGQEMEAARPWEGEKGTRREGDTVGKRVGGERGQKIRLYAIWT